MLWHAIDTPREYGSVYRSDTHDIRHYVGGFGNWIAVVYARGDHSNGRPVRTFAGERALSDAQAWAEAAQREAAA